MTVESTLEAEADEFRQDYDRIRAEVGKVIVGQERVVECAMTAIVCGGNVLLEGVPGLGKTMLVRTLSRVLDLEFRRIQFTPDLMPADIIGTTVMTADPDGRYRFEFRQGPLFTQLLLADEINRATPKTQSALLEAMQEGSVTAGHTTYQLAPAVLRAGHAEPHRAGGHLPAAGGAARPLHVQGQRALPEPRRAERGRQPHHPGRPAGGGEGHGRRPAPGPAGDCCRRSSWPTRCATTPAAWRWPRTRTRSTRTEGVRKYVRWGASPRASQALILAGRVHALADGRAHVSFGDVRHFAQEVLQHRVLLNYDGLAENVRVTDLIADVLEGLPEEA